VKKRVLIAVLNWGLGHATRSERIIREVLSNNGDVYLASSGDALRYLEHRFPFIPTHNIPDLEVRYNKKSAFPGLIKRGIVQRRINKKQKSWIDAFVVKNGITHIISDNVYGAWSAGVPSALITHQLGLLSPVFKSFINKKLASWINNFNQVWVPDIDGNDSIAGEMLLNKYVKRKLLFLGNCSRFNLSENTPKAIDYLAVLSGVEPQRSALEEKLLEIFSQLEGKKVLICGKENRPDGNRLGTEIIGIARSDQIENLILQSRLVICRSGYTSVADLLKLRENALLVPTPGQPEQIYLAKRCREKDWFTTADQKELTTEIFTHAIEKNKPKPRANMEWSGSEIITRFLK